MTQSKILRDGRGKPIDENAFYYIQDTRQVVGNCALFWRPDGAGYTCDLLVDEVRKRKIVHVCVERQRNMAPKRRARKAK